MDLAMEMQLKFNVWQEVMRNDRERVQFNRASGFTGGCTPLTPQQAQDEAERIYARMAGFGTSERAAYLESTIREEIALRAGNDSMAVDRLSGALSAAPR